MLVILVGGIPIAMPTVLSVTLALGAAKLAKEGAIVARMSAVEEMAGMDILCSDKTGGWCCVRGGWLPALVPRPGGLCRGAELIAEAPSAAFGRFACIVQRPSECCRTQHMPAGWWSSARVLIGLPPLRRLTGTLTLNKLSIESGNIFVTEPGLTIDDVLKYGALSADITGEEPIDMVLHQSYPNVSPGGDPVHPTPYCPGFSPGVTGQSALLTYLHRVDVRRPPSWPASSRSSSGSPSTPPTSSPPSRCWTRPAAACSACSRARPRSC